MMASQQLGEDEMTTLLQDTQSNLPFALLGPYMYISILYIYLRFQTMFIPNQMLLKVLNWFVVEVN